MSLIRDSNSCNLSLRLINDPNKQLATPTQYNPRWRTSQPKRKQRKRGRRSGRLVRFRKRPNRPPLPAICLTNAQSLIQKRDDLFLLIQSKREYTDCSVFCITETWFNDSHPDSYYQPQGFTLHRADRVPELAQKDTGGGVCLLINQRWCTDSTKLSTSCSPNLETLVVKCVPFYSPREFSSFIFIGVYITTSANKKEAIHELSNIIYEVERQHPDSTIFILGDFNRAPFQRTITKFKPQISCNTRKDAILDQCYMTIKDAYHSIARPPLGRSDHNVMLMIPAYRQKLKTQKPQVKTVKQWTPDSILTLQGCLECTDWDVFKNSCSTLDEYTDTVSSYISFCEQACIPTKTVKIYPNSKPWFRKDIKKRLDDKNNAFQTKDKDLNKKTQYEYEKAIRQGKMNYKKKIEEKFEQGESRDVWQGMAKITDYKSKASITDPDPTLPDKLNEFYNRFDEKNNYPPPPSPTADDISVDPPFTVSESSIIKEFKKLNVRKAAGPDEISPATLKHCAPQVASVYSDIFNESIKQCVVPKCFKTSTIIPVPKKPKISSLNDFRPVALTPISMKVLERFILNYLKSITDEQMDPHQFAYRANRSVEDAVSLALYHVLKHLESPKSYARLLFIDYSSAFNTIIPCKLAEKLSCMNIHPSIVFWICDFLKERPQRVKIGNIVSDTRTLSTGAPQGCVLSPLLFTLFTNDCQSQDQSTLIFKFSDDTTLEGLISNADEQAYRDEVERLVTWCNTNDLELNVKKTKEIIVDFRKEKTPIIPLTINNEEVEIVDDFKFLGTTISKDLKWEKNAKLAAKKANKRLFFLRQLKKFRVQQRILILFYRATIESVLAFSLSTWYGNATCDDKRLLDSVVKAAEKIIGCELPSIASIYRSRISKRANKIIADDSHPARQLFEKLPSGRRLRLMKCNSKRLANSFFPSAIRILSGQVL